MVRLCVLPLQRLNLYAGNTTAQESMFVYGAGASHDGYTDPSFEPQFEQPEVDDATKRRAAEICGGADAKDCIFDYLMTGKESVARDTAEAVRQHDSAIDSAKKGNNKMF